jgi:serpin B
MGPRHAHTSLALALLALLSGLSACDCQSGPRTQPTPPEIRQGADEDPSQNEVAEPSSESLFSRPPARSVEPPTPAQASAFAASSNALGLDLYGKLREQEAGNFALSPASITLAFDMVFGGARGETGLQMATVMHLEGHASEVHDAAGRVLGRWNDPSRTSYELRVVNRLFGEQSFRFQQDYLTLTRDAYRAPFEGVDFRGAAETQRERINAWVAEQTNDRITDLLPDGALDAQTRLVLVNAVYFLGTWLETFDPELTEDEPFTLADGTEVRLPMMNNQLHARYGAHDGAKVVELDYEGGDLAMTLVIPDAHDGLPALEEKLTEDYYGRLISTFGTQEVRLALPRFEMKSRFSLSDALKALGMELVFDEDAADLTGIGVPREPGMRLVVTEAFHQAYVKTDEQGTEAAAATGVVMGVAGGPPPPEPVTVRADRPFLFLIRDKANGTILFMGRVSDPRS